MAENIQVDRFVSDLAQKIGAQTAEQFDTRFADLGIDQEGRSPPEQLLGAAILYAIESLEHFGSEGRNNTFFYANLPRSLEMLNLKDEKDCGINIHPQLAVGPYAADFFVVFRHWRGGLALGTIECDGHAFHERTKEQAAKDKKRDRYFQARGLTVLRYTASEIYCNPLKIALDSLVIFDDLAEAKSGDSM